MDFYSLIERLRPDLNRLVKILNDESISPELRKQTIAAAFDRVGQAVYGKSYHMTAWDMEIMETIGKGVDPAVALGLARNLSDGIATGDVKEGLDQAKNYVHSSNAAAMADATKTAGQLGKYRVVTRSLRAETCGWCREMAGKYINPSNEVFRRHTRCDCLIKVQGFKSRNGELKNYRPQ